MKDNLTAVSLFTGAGGMDTGFENAGFDIICANEIDASAAETYSANHPGTEMHVRDINRMMPEFSRFAGVDLVFGGPPCQGFSVVGKMDPCDERSQLIWSFFKAVRIIKPRAFVMENVKALADNARWSDVAGRIIKTAEGLGYDVSFKVLNAADYGVPQKRERVFFAGLRDQCAESVFERAESRRKPPRTIRDTFLALPAAGSPSNPLTCTAKIVPAASPILRPSPYKGSLLFNGKGRLLDPSSIAGTIPASLGGNNTPIIDEHLLRHPEDGDPMLEYHQELLRGNLSPALPDTLRRVTVTEVAALQTFPEGYAFHGSKSSIYHQIGNAVPCLLAEAVAGALREALCQG